MEPLIVHATDFYGLSANVFRPAGAPLSAVLVAPAMGVPQRFYRAFAEHLALRGHLVMTVDYRGIGDSAPRDLRRFHAELHHWGERDLTGAAHALRALAGPDVPLRFVGHSVGGQLMGMVDGVPFERALMVASQSGYWGHWSGPLRAAMYAFWHAGVPALVKTHGVLPMRRLGQGQDVPAGVALEWAGWGRTPQYLQPTAAARGNRGYAHWNGQLLQVAVADDPYAPLAAVDALGALYTGARRARAVVAPRDVGVPAIGHFGFFRPALGPLLWNAATAFLEEGTWTLPVMHAISADTQGDLAEALATS